MSEQEDLELALRREWGRLLALLVARFRRIDLAEDALGDAFEAAARTWPVDGTPDNPAAWLLTAARRRVLDRLRAESVAAQKAPLLVVDRELAAAGARVMADPGGLIDDERLRLLLLCAHPALAPEAAAALSLRLVLGVPTVDIARLFHVPQSTMAARLTRARRKIALAGIPFAVPSGRERDRRLETVASVAYLAFTAGYAPMTGDAVVRLDLAGEAVRLVRVLEEVTEGDPLVRSLLALVLLQHSRRDARTTPSGDLVLLPDQNRSRWHREEIDEALALLRPLLGADLTGSAREYCVQALVAAEHALAPTSADTRWDVIAGLYAELEQLTGSPVVRLNRAVAVAEAEGPAAGLALLEGLDRTLPRSHRLPAVRAELLARTGDVAGARTAADRALELCGNEAEREHLRRRRADLGPA
ncbi:DUF6596 domain-containing protein [Nocardioides sp. 616]|uniref:RNA polymerase sigma factor n=1 Tax=Nocardioides sp. 616 TaxID=2268090 RepID=UPI000CE4E869|nr:DUF6596 domain-containing protein [Nocardioides sp. 616]